MSCFHGRPPILASEVKYSLSIPIAQGADISNELNEDVTTMFDVSSDGITQKAPLVSLVCLPHILQTLFWSQSTGGLRQSISYASSASRTVFLMNMSRVQQRSDPHTIGGPADVVNILLDRRAQLFLQVMVLSTMPNPGHCQQAGQSNVRTTTAWG